MAPGPMRVPNPPENEIPSMLLVEGMITRTPQVVLWIADVNVYSCGVAFTVEARQRTTTVMLNMFDFGRPHPPASSPPLMIGVEDAASAVATNLPGVRGALHPGRGHGNGFSGSAGYWLSRLPAPGPLAIIVAWPYFGLPETRFELDGEAIAQAASRVEVLWPEPDTSRYPDPTVGEYRHFEPELAKGGWFESAKAKQPPPPPLPRLPPGYTRINYAFDPEDTSG
jgi:hypothetical protein